MIEFIGFFLLMLLAFVVGIVSNILINKQYDRDKKQQQAEWREYGEHIKRKDRSGK